MNPTLLAVLALVSASDQSATPSLVIAADDLTNVSRAGAGTVTGWVSREQLHWPHWRGPLGTGEAPGATPPVEWEEGKNIRWKTALPGVGHSSPIVWRDQIVLTAAIPFGKSVTPKPDTAPGAHDNSPVTHHHQFDVLALDRKTGAIRWRKTVRKELPHEGGHYTGSLASNSPATDGKHVFAFFGSRGLYCFDLSGTLVWKKDLGKMSTKHAHGEGSSPVIHSGVLVVNWDHEDQSFIVGFDSATGQQIWRVTRDEVTSWASPIVLEHDGRTQVVVSGTRRIRGYDLKTGEVIWECGGLSANVVASPVYGDGIVFAASSYDTRALLAIELDGARGDLTGSAKVLWSRRRGTPYVPSPLLYDGALYFLRHYQGILTKVEARNGRETAGPFRLGGLRDIYASPVAAANRIYVTDRSGSTMVISHGPKPEVLAFNRLDDSFSASAAVVGDDLILRGERYLYCLSSK